MADDMARGGADHRGRILLVTPASPVPPDSGGAQRTALLYEALARDFRVDLFLLDRVDPAVRDMLARDFGLVGLFRETGLLRRVLLRLAGSVSPQLRAALPNGKMAAAIARKMGQENYQAVVLRYSATACQLHDLRRRCPGLKVYLDVDDFLSQLLQPAQAGAARGRLARRLGDRLAAPWVQRRERKALLGADGLWINGPSPAWLRESDGLKVVPLPNIPFHAGPKEGRMPAGNRSPVEYIGVAQFRYSPNHEGFDWFLRQVWPRIRASAPEARLRLVGMPPRSSFRQRWRAIPGVELTGRVEDIAAEYARARVAIAPIQRGGGTKIKVLEALAMGLPCVCSRHAALGMGELSGLMATDDPAAFARHCLELVADEPRRKALGNGGRCDVERIHSRSRFLAGVRRLVGAGENAHRESPTPTP